MFVCLKKLITAAFMGCAGLGAIAFGACAPNAATAAEIVNVEYIVGFVKNKWDVDVPYVKEEIHWAANVEYLLKVVDYVNGKLNNGEKTNYGESEYATKEAVDTIAANQAIRTLIKKKGPDYKFFFTPAESNGNEFKFFIGAKGTFYIDWDDGTTNTIEKTELGLQEIAHEYADAASNHTIKLGGMATEYAPPMAEEDLNSVAIIFFDMNKGGPMELSSIDGCLGCVFPTLANGAQPVFFGAFAYQEQLKTLPSTLFNNITGAGYPMMFAETFGGCSGLESLPDKLFGELSGAPAKGMFTATFQECSGLTEILENLFAGIQGAPTEYMFAQTFYGCSSLTSIPANLFVGIQGAPAEGMFQYTFYGCRGLTSIPEHLFDGIDTSGAYQEVMFHETFRGCTSLTGPSARINGQYLYEIWPDASYQSTYGYATGLSDYDCIPYSWGGSGKKNPGECPIPETE